LTPRRERDLSDRVGKICSLISTFVINLPSLNVSIGVSERMKMMERLDRRRNPSVEELLPQLQELWELIHSYPRQVRSEVREWGLMKLDKFLKFSVGTGDDLDKLTYPYSGKSLRERKGKWRYLQLRFWTLGILTKIDKSSYEDALNTLIGDMFAYPEYWFSEFVTPDSYQTQGVVRIVVKEALSILTDITRNMYLHPLLYSKMVDVLERKEFGILSKIEILKVINDYYVATERGEPFGQQIELLSDLNIGKDGEISASDKVIIESILQDILLHIKLQEEVIP